MSRQFDEVYFSSGRYLLDYGEWVPCAGYPNYLICREGYVSRNGKVLKPHRGDIQGHLNVRLWKNGRVHEEYIHRLVAKTFIPNPMNYPFVGHLDDDKENNHVDNLAWGTHKDNYEDSVYNGTAYFISSEDREKGLAKIRKPVISHEIATGQERYFVGQTEAARRLGLQQANIGKVLLGERRHTGGYMFRFATEEEITHGTD